MGLDRASQVPSSSKRFAEHDTRTSYAKEEDCIGQCGNGEPCVLCDVLRSTARFFHVLRYIKVETMNANNSMEGMHSHCQICAYLQPRIRGRVLDRSVKSKEF